MGKIGTWIAGIVIFSLVSVGIMVATKTGFVVVDGWEVGVKKERTNYVMAELNPGYHFFNPVLDSVIEINGRPIQFNYSAKNAKKEDTQELRYDGMITGVDKNGIPMSVAVAIEVKPIKNMMAEGYQEDGTFENMLEKKAVQPNESIVRDVMGEFDVKSVQSVRNAFAKRLNDLIRESYKENKYFTLVGSVDLKQIELPKAVRDGQISVQLAAQEAEKSARLVEKAKNVAKSVEEEAKGRARAYEAEAKGKANAILIEATAQAQANNLLSKSLTEKIIRIQTIEKWNGVKSMVQGGTQGLILDLGNTK